MAPHLNNLQCHVEHQTTPPRFVGSCCFVSESKKALDRASGNPFLDADGGKKQRKPDLPAGPTCTGGCFCAPECNLLVLTCFESVDAIGQAAEHKSKAVWHCVTSEVHSHKLERATTARPSVISPTNLPNDWTCKKRCCDEREATR